MPGRRADVSIIVKQLNDVTEVPTGAISYGTNGQATVTEVVNGGAHVVKDVTVGRSENGETQITGGVSAGDKVLEREITFKARPAGRAAALRRRRTAPGVGGFPGARRGRLRRRWRSFPATAAEGSDAGDDPHSPTRHARRRRRRDR